MKLEVQEEKSLRHTVLLLEPVKRLVERVENAVGQHLLRYRRVCNLTVRTAPSHPTSHTLVPTSTAKAETSRQRTHLVGVHFVDGLHVANLDLLRRDELRQVDGRPLQFRPQDLVQRRQKRADVALPAMAPCRQLQRHFGQCTRDSRSELASVAAGDLTNANRVPWLRLRRRPWPARPRLPVRRLRAPAHGEQLII